MACYLVIEQGTKVANISEQLAKLRESVEQAGHIHATLFTLIIFIESPRRVPYFQEMIKKVIEKFPCRILFIEIEPSEKDLFDADVSIETLGVKNQMTFCDQIWVRCSSNNLERIPFLVLPQMIPDLPVFLLWSSEAHLDLFTKLQKISTRIIYDSDHVSSLKEFAKNTLCNFEKADCEVADLNWARLAGWRDVIWRAFNTPEHLHQLALTQSIKITYNETPQSSIQNLTTLAIYLQGWFAAQFKWGEGRYTSDNPLTICYENSETPTEVAVLPMHNQALPAGIIMSLEITTPTHHYQLIREGATRRVRFNVSTKETCQLPYYFLLSNLNRGHSMVREMLYGRTSNHYRNMLTSISELKNFE